MVQINPRALNVKAEDLPNGKSTQSSPPRNSNLSFMTLVKTGIASAIEKVFQNSVMKVQLENEKQLTASLQQVIDGIREFNKTQKSIQIGKGSITTPKVETATISNLEELKLENVEKLSFALEQLKPVITSLQAGNRLDQQSVALLKNIITSLSQVNTNVKGIKFEFPVETLLSGLKDVENSVKALKLEVPEQKEISIPPFPKNISITEGKMILSALKDVSAKLDALPKRYPEVTIPKTISVDNFPPSKYPIPPTNININALHGYLKSTALTVGTSAVGLPTTALANRRSMVVYNNDSTNTLYLGGSDVTTSNGIPVPPLSYSPPIDNGPKMILYGIASTNINVRVLEASNERGPYDT